MQKKIEFLKKLIFCPLKESKKLNSDFDESDGF